MRRAPSVRGLVAAVEARYRLASCVAVLRKGAGVVFVSEHGEVLAEVRRLAVARGLAASGSPGRLEVSRLEVSR